MPNINLSTKIRKSPSLVYEILKDMEKFPLFMRDAYEVKVKKLSDEVIIAEWKADIDGTPIEWKERVKFNDKEKRLKFKMLEGDFKEYEGTWTLTPIKSGTKLEIETRLEWGVPNFERYIGSILEKKARKSIEGMLWLIRKRAHAVK